MLVGIEEQCFVSKLIERTYFKILTVDSIRSKRIYLSANWVECEYLRGNGFEDVRV
jgi:hypothetical protein